MHLLFCSLRCFPSLGLQVISIRPTDVRGEEAHHLPEMSISRPSGVGWGGSPASLTAWGVSLFRLSPSIKARRRRWRALRGGRGRGPGHRADAAGEAGAYSLGRGGGGGGGVGGGASPRPSRRAPREGGTLILKGRVTQPRGRGGGRGRAVAGAQRVPAAAAAAVRSLARFPAASGAPGPRARRRRRPVSGGPGSMGGRRGLMMAAGAERRPRGPARAPPRPGRKNPGGRAIGEGWPRSLRDSGILRPGLPPLRRPPGAGAEPAVPLQRRTF